MNDVIVVGGGASGLAAAIEAARGGCRVTVLEQKERTGKKILATGNGRCNLTNLHMDPDTCYRGGNPAFVRDVLGRVTVAETLVWFGDLGIPTKDRNGYVYPRSDQASAVAEALAMEAEHLGVRILCGMRVESISFKGENSGNLRTAGEFAVTAEDRTDGERKVGERKAGEQKARRRETFRSRAVILAAGSKAAPATGSDGSGYELAEALGHKIIPPLPALVQLICRGRIFRQLAGIRTDGRIRLFVDGEPAAADRGEVQLTEQGISGIPAFQVSRFASAALAAGRLVEASLDFLPDWNREQILEFLTARRSRLAYRKGESFLSGLFAGKLGAVLMSSAGISLTDPVSQIPDRKLEKLADQIRDFRAPVTGTRSFDSAQVCCGGVCADQVFGATMESRITPGLYLTGELLDVDGICGGYNLQWAWSTGILAGRSAAKIIREGGDSL